MKEKSVPVSWREENGVVFSVTSDGTTGEQWIARLKKKGFQITADVEEVLNSPRFQPTFDVTTEVIILKVSILENKFARLTFFEDVRSYAVTRPWTKPHPEVACLIREKFTDEEIRNMGLKYIVAMHEPIINAFDGGNPLILCIVPHGLGVEVESPNQIYILGKYGFAFAGGPRSRFPYLKSSWL